jgi:hypothetical protein
MSRLPSGDITVLFIATRWIPSHKWVVNDDGLCDYNGDLITPREVYDRFLVDYPMFDVLRGEVSTRVMNDDEGRPYRWIDLERFI